jgi:hypothetical protein
MGYRTVTIGNFGDREKKIVIIRKIWHRFGRGGFIYAWLPNVLSKSELKMVNLNRWKHRNLVTHNGWESIKGKPRRKWKLTSQTIEKCVEKGDCLQND